MALLFQWTFLVLLTCSNVAPSFSTEDVGQLNLTMSDLIISSYQESLQLVNAAFLRARQRRNAPAPSTHKFKFHRQSEPETMAVSRAAEVFQTTVEVLEDKAKRIHGRDVKATEFLSVEDVELIAHLSRCPPPTHTTLCHHNSKYRTISGVCNNRKNPLWGAANIPLVRWLSAEYEDGERDPKGWTPGQLYNGVQLPPPREISIDILKASFKTKDDVYSQLLVEWGQYLDHDITFTPQSTGISMSTEDCFSTCERVHPCFPIETSDGCMPFHRSLPSCYFSRQSVVEETIQRQQINSITSYMDASFIYGHSPKMESALRDLAGLAGKLAVNEQFIDPNGRSYLPFVSTLPSSCQQDEQGGVRVECFNAGDTRANEGMPLTVLHTLWVREHNRVAEALKGINRHWNPETIYQETRKIIGAMHQIIHMRDYVPKIIGTEAFEHYIGSYRGYDPNTDPSASNVFATAAFRFGHGTIPMTLQRLNESFQAHDRFPTLHLHDTFFSPWRIVKEGGLEPVLRGVFGTAAISTKANMLMAEEVIENLHVPESGPHMDLASLNLQRGRDHGLPGYNAWREFCRLGRIETLDALTAVVGDGRVAAKILRKYQHLDNVDVWLGGLAEKMLPGARTGPLFACLIGMQMKVLRDGDRFWWETEGFFTPQQKAELIKASFSRIVCDNTDIGEIPNDPFRLEKYPSNFLPCSRIPSMTLEAWREEKHVDLQQCGLPARIMNGDYILSSTHGKLVALYSCYHGFQLEGTAAVVCEGNRWSDQAPQCEGSHQ